MQNTCTSELANSSRHLNMIESQTNSTHKYSKTLSNIISFAYPPILLSPTPPSQALIYAGSAYNLTGTNVPLEKYGPTGDIITYSRAEPLLLTPMKD